MAEFTKCAKVNEVTDGSPKFVTIGGNDVALFNVNGEIFACANSCAHQGGPLSEGFVEGKIVTCPWHNWKYDVSSGECLSNPSIKIANYKTKIDGDDILIEV